MKNSANRFISMFIVIILTLVSYQSAFASQDESPLAAGTVYYVSPTGSDNNSCTQSAPCKSFNKAMSLAVSGDTVIALQGIYNEMVTIAKSGLTLEGQGATIDTTAQNGIYVKPNVQNIVIRGFTITRTKSHAIFIEGKFVTVENNTVYHSVLENGSLSGNTITCRNDSWGSAIKAGNGSSSLVIRNNTVYENCGEGIAATRSNDVTIENNTTYDNYGVNIYIDNSYNVRVLNNNGYCTVSVPAGIALGEENYSGWGAQLHDVLVSGNTVTNCYFGFVAFGSDVGGTLTNVTVSNNYFPSGARRGISILSELNSNVLIQNNVHFNDIYVAFPKGVTLSGNTKVSGSTAPTPTAISPTNTSMPPTMTSLPTQTVAAATTTPFPDQSTPTATALATGISPTPLSTETAAPATATSISTEPPAVTVTPLPTSTTVPIGTTVLTSASPKTLLTGQTGTVSVSLANLPASGFVGIEFTCAFAPETLSASNIQVSGLFGTDPVFAFNDSQNGNFIVAIAGSNGNKITSDGTAFTFSVSALNPGQSTIECTARVSTGDDTLTSISSISDVVTVLDNSPTAIAATATPILPPTLTGQVIAKKTVTVSLLNADSSLAATTTTNSDGTFSLTADPGSYLVIASAEGYLNSQGTVTLADGVLTTLPPITLPAGDIDNNDVIDQYDALTLGMNYNVIAPATADLSNDGLTNILDLEMLAENFRKAGALAWQ